MKSSLSKTTAPQSTGSRAALLAVALGSLTLVLATGCKGETTYKDRQETLDRLELTEAALKEKTDVINRLNGQVSDLQMNSGTVEISMAAPKSNGEPGAIVEVKGRGPNSRGASPDPKGNAKDTELYSAFIEKVRASRGSVRKCYETALKKSAELQTKTVTVMMTVNYRTSGQVSSASFSPSLTPNFSACMKTVAGRWKLPAMPKPTRFTYRQKLTPQ